MTCESDSYLQQPPGLRWVPGGWQRTTRWPQRQGPRRELELEPPGWGGGGRRDTELIISGGNDGLDEKISRNYPGNITLRFMAGISVTDQSVVERRVVIFFPCQPYISSDGPGLTRPNHVTQTKIRSQSSTGPPRSSLWWMKLSDHSTNP